MIRYTSPEPVEVDTALLLAWYTWDWPDSMINAVVRSWDLWADEFAQAIGEIDVCTDGCGCRRAKIEVRYTAIAECPYADELGVIVWKGPTYEGPTEEQVADRPWERDLRNAHQFLHTCARG